MKKILWYLKPYRLRMLLGMIVKIIGTIMDLMLPWLLTYILNDVIPLGDVSMIILFGGVMCGVAIVGITGNVFANRSSAHVARDAIETIRYDLFSKSIHLSERQIDQISIPSLTSRMTNDTYNVQQMISRVQRLGVRAPILFIGGVVITLIMDTYLSMVLLFVTPIICMIIYGISKYGVPLYRNLQSKIDCLVQSVRETVSGIRVVKALSKEEYEINRFEKRNTDCVDAETKAAVTMAISNPLMNLLMNFGLVAVIIVGAYRVSGRQTDAANIIAFTTYFTIISQAMIHITKIFILISKGSASATRIAEVLTLPDELLLTKDESKSASYIEFKNVSFSYETKNNLDNISFSLKKGETLGIIGGTGSGKTTLIKLLVRLYDPVSGEIYVDGRNVKSFLPSELRKKFGIVFQNDNLFSDSIYDNVDFYRGLAKEEIDLALKTSQADFVKEQGSDKMLVAKGMNLSGGQKQRLLIARAIAANPEILVLDDSSSALDYQTDAKLRSALAKQGQTKIYISQRISSISGCDKIIVLDGGKMIGFDTHSKLLQTCPIYQEISLLEGGQVKYE